MLCMNELFGANSGFNKLCRKHFSCWRENLKISGTVFFPRREKGSRYPIAILCHEFMTNQAFSYPYAKALAACGYAAFCFDFCGGGLISTSQGNSREMSVLTEIKDLKAVIAFARSQRYVNANDLLMMGCSQGGLVAALTAAQMPELVKSLILLYPALAIPDAARAGNMLWMKFDPSNVPKKLHSGPMLLGRNYVLDVLNMDAYHEIAKYHGRILIVHGDRDTLVDIFHSRKARYYYQAAGASVRLVSISGGKHIFRRPSQIRQVQKEIRMFVGNSKDRSCH